MASAYTEYGHAAAAPTPQSRPIPGREHEMVANNAGGYTFVLDDWERLNRFLILGSEGGTYYVAEKNLTKQNADAVVRCIKADGERVVALARDINVQNRAPKVDSQLFVLALALKHGDAATKRACYASAPLMLRTGTHLLHFVAMLDSLGGWNRSKRSVIKAWFEQAIEPLSYQMVKYQNRDGWRMGDVLRLAHPLPLSEQHDALFKWAVGKLDLHIPESDGSAPRPLEMATKMAASARCPTGQTAALPSVLVAHQHMLNMAGTPVEKALWGVAHLLPREALPTEALADVAVQRKQLPHLPIHALIRNLGNFTSSGLMEGEDVKTVVSKLTDKSNLQRSRVHPFAIMLASLVYKTGHGMRGSKTWVPNKRVLEALDDAYELAFDNVTPTGKRILIGVDISASMSQACVGTLIPASTAAAAMALTLARLEPHALVVQFDTTVQRIMPVTKRTGLSSLENTAGGGTDVSAPIRWASGEAPTTGFAYRGARPQVTALKQDFDAFVICTDNETWAGSAHLTQVLETYRRGVNQAVKLVCLSFAANHANIVDPADPRQFGCAGLDANIPALVGDFIGR